jgi:predicted regulator of Ras-like GTPase activity (Roadblock/LC7/MglB family)
MKARGGIKPRGRQSAPRDQHESAFAAILGDLVKRVPGARGAALVDRDGETVDYSGRGNPYEMRVAAAHFRIVLDEARRQASLGDVRSIVARAARASIAVQALPDGYALVLRLARGAGFRGLGRAIPVCIQWLTDEAGWPAARSPWYAVDVVSDERGTPRLARVVGQTGSASGAESTPVEVLGRYRAALPEHERAWRVRLPSGVELTLLQESSGFWYVDEPLIPRVSGDTERPLQRAKKNL